MPETTPGSPVLEFYNDAKIFITGGTGFFGKALIDKFLRVCPSVNHIYLLIRPKKGKDPHARMKEIFNDPVFERLLKEKPDFEKKITCIPGDVGAPRMNMSENDYELLANEVTHVFHSAATVRFNEKLKTAFEINVVGTHEMVNFCNKCTRLKVLVHVSTAYSFCVRSEIDEEFYDPPLSGKQTLSLTKALSEDKINSIAEELIKPWPNSYSYTKAIAENIIKENRSTFPVALFRPAIVMGSMKDPVEGWIDNIYGPTGLIAAVGVGLLRVMLAHDKNEAQIIPIDLTANAMICSAWDVGTTAINTSAVENPLAESKEIAGTDKKEKAATRIYNFVVDDSNRITWGRFSSINLTHGRQMPSIKSIWYYTLILTGNKYLYTLFIWLLHYLPGILGDGIFIAMGKKPQLCKAYRKIHVFAKLISYFAVNSWKFDNSNIKKMCSRLSDADRELFNCDTSKIVWEIYLLTVLHGIRRFILYENEDTIPAAKRKFLFLWLAHRLLQCAFVVFSLWILSKFLFTYGDLKTHFKEPMAMHSGILRNST